MDTCGFGRCALLALALLCTLAACNEGVRTRDRSKSSDSPVVKSRPIVFPTRTTAVSPEKATIVSTLRNEGKQKQAEEDGLEESKEDVETTKSVEDFPNNLDAHFTYTESLTPSYYYYDLEPTKRAGESKGISVTGQGEGARAPRSKQMPVGPSTVPSTETAALNSTTTSRSEKRKTQPDIHEIITGFVKLFNGNMPISASATGPASRPIRRRINNRGPPRITDLPPFVLDPPPPSLVPPPPPTTHDPPPYPFEKPDTKHIIKPFVSGVPLPEQIVPTGAFGPPEIDSLRPPVRPLRPGLQDADRQKNSSQPFIDPTSITLITEPSSSINNSDSSSIKMNATKVLGVNVSSTVTTVDDLSRPTSSFTAQIAPTPSSSIPHVQSTLPSQDASAPNKQTEKKNITDLLNFKEKGIVKKNITDSNFTKITDVKNKTDMLKKDDLQVKNSSETLKPTLTSEIPMASTSLSNVGSSPSLPSLPSNSEESHPGESVPLLEPSIVEISPSKDIHKPTKWEYHTGATKPYKGGAGSGAYSPRPGIVLDDPEYKPGLKLPPTPHRGSGPGVPILTAPPRGEVFDVTVSAIQGPGGASGSSPSTGQPLIYPVELEGVSLPGAGSGEVSVITSAQAGQHYVSIEGKRTYINLFGSTEPATISPTSAVKSTIKPTVGGYQSQQQRPKRPPPRRPQHPPVRIDTCIVGDWSTCDSEQHEVCRTEQGVSSCHCAPGYSRHSHRQPCKRVVSVIASVKVEKLYDQKLSWTDKYTDVDSQEYLQMEYEAVRAMESAMSMTPFSDAYMGSKLNNIYTNNGVATKPVILNMTLQVEESPESLRPQIKNEIQKHLLGAIHRRSNNIGTSPLWASPVNSVSALQDLDECRSPDLNDCHVAASCRNTFGSFECKCPDGYKDDFANNPHKSGRRCETCSPDHCNHRGTCSYRDGQPTCSCAGNYYGSQCEVDGEVLGVAIGASVAAVVIILSTLACLCMWSRRWNKEQKMAGIGSPVFGYMPSGGSTVKTPGVGAPPYQVSLEDRIRWAQIADAMAQATNHYASLSTNLYSKQPEPVGAPTRPASAMFGYGTLPVAPLPLPRLGLRPASVHNLRQDSSSEEEDRTDLLGRTFQVPRPKSRSSIANQSGIYYDVDYEQQADHFSSAKHPAIPLSTYTMGRSHYYRT